jgi:hypothetical protein
MEGYRAIMTAKTESRQQPKTYISLHSADALTTSAAMHAGAAEGALLRTMSRLGHLARFCLGDAGYERLE